MANPNIPHHGRYNKVKHRYKGFLAVILWLLFASFFIAMALMQERIVFAVVLAAFIAAGILAAIAFYSYKSYLVSVDFLTEMQQQKQYGIASDDGFAIKVLHGLSMPFIAIAVFSLLACIISAAPIAAYITPAITGFMGYGLRRAALQQEKNYTSFGTLNYLPDPMPLVIGGQLGGSFKLLGRMKGDLNVYLRQRASSHSGESTSTGTSYQQRIDAEIKDLGNNLLEVKFVCDIPEGMDPSDTSYHKTSIWWELHVEGLMYSHENIKGTSIAPVVELARSWRLSIVSEEFARAYGFTVHKSKTRISPEIKEQVAAKRKTNAKQSAAKQIQIEQNNIGQTVITSDSGRNSEFWGLFFLFGLGFPPIGLFLLSQASITNVMLYFMGATFLIFGLAALAFAVYLSGRKLEARFHDQQVQVIRSLFNKPIFQQNGQITDYKQLSLESTMANTSQTGVKTDYYGLYAYLQGKRIKLVEGIAGHDEAQALKQKVANLLGLEAS